MPGALWLILLLIILIASRTLAGQWIEYEWWKELGHGPIFWNRLLYTQAPVLSAGLVAAVALWIALARGLKHGGSGLGRFRGLAGISVVAALVGGFALASSTVNSWNIALYIGGRDVPAGSWTDPVFQHPLSFYLFNLPFYRNVFSYVIVLSLLTAVVYWLASRATALKSLLPEPGQDVQLDFSALGLGSALGSGFLRGVCALILLALGLSAWLGRYGLLMTDHGFMVGVNYTDEHIRLPLIWVLAGAHVVSAALVLAGMWRGIFVVAAAYLIHAVAPQAVAAIFVRPNEINLERPYIERHIESTRQAFALATRVKETDFAARLDARIEPARHAPLLENVRLWDWRAFHDTVTQIQALRPYYVFADSDVDRYTIDGKLRQVMLTPRELDIRQLPDAQTRWINPHFVYTHGYGMVMAEANRITTEGLPHLFVQDAPAQIKSSNLKLTRPEIYFGEITHEPVFVRSAQKEFSYPSGNDSVFTRYEGRGGIPLSWSLRIASAIRYMDVNILLTNLMGNESRMLIRRDVDERLRAVAGFVQWETDPYLVVTDEGRLVWTVDGYTSSESHPYSRHFRVLGQRLNYMRNSVKATIDAYDGAVRLYVFDPADPVLAAYQRLFPGLFQPAAAMPADLRRHVRYPETLFRLQAEVYRTYHMRDPQAFYNKEDLWDIARAVHGKENRPQQLDPTYILATLPGETEPEFLLLIPFTPRNKDNLIGLMIARCDGDKLGEIEFLQLSKQALIFGPMQVEARINQDPDISKDLTLWSQKGSEVLRGHIVVLPVGNNILYVEPIYIQASEARMPQLKKVVIAVGNELIYRDTYQEALAALGAVLPGPSPPPPTGTPAASAVTLAAAPSPEALQRLAEVRQRLRRYRDLWSQGKYSEAGRELEAVESLIGR